MNLLTSLPPELSQTVFLSWLDLIDIAHVDSAMCSKQNRPRFLTAAYSIHSVFNYADFFSNTNRRKARYYHAPGFLPFVQLRGVQLSSMQVDKPDDENVNRFPYDDIHQAIIRKSGSHLKHIWTVRHTRAIFPLIAEHCPNLQRMDFINGLAQEDLELILASCHNLQHITLVRLTAEITRTLMQYGERLRSLTIHGNYHYENWYALYESFPNLQRLHLASVDGDNDLICALIKHCPRLRSLVLADCSELAEFVMYGLGLSCREVKEIELTSLASEYMYHCLFAACPNLTSIALNYCAELTDDVITWLGEDFPGLRKLRLGSFAGDVALLAAQAQRWPQLRSLSLSSFDGLTDVALHAFSTHCKHLRVVSLWGCSKVTDTGVIRLAQACIHLQDLNLCHCYLLTDASLHAIITNCRYIEKVDVTCCSSITADCVERYKMFAVQWHTGRYTQRLDT
jgi:hypothetical protein